MNIYKYTHIFTNVHKYALHNCQASFLMQAGPKTRRRIQYAIAIGEGIYFDMDIWSVVI